MINIIIEATLIIKIKDIKTLPIEGKVIYETLKRLFTYKNPKFLENLKYGYSNHSTPKYLYSFNIYEGNINISRGCLEAVIQHFKDFNIKVQTIDRTYVSKSISFEQSKTVLRDDQIEFFNKMTKHTYGSGIGYTSFGKTLTLLEIARFTMQRTLVIVHTTFLQEQWIEEATNPKLFNIDKSRIGGVGGVFSGKKRKLGDLNICLYHSLMREEHINFFEPHIGCVLFDEGQKSPVEGVQQVTNAFRGRYRYTASADLKRKDGKEFLTFDTFGPIRVQVQEQASDSKILSRIYLNKTNFVDNDYAIDSDYAAMLTRMALIKDRNILICKRAIKKVRDSKLVVIFVERKFQAGILYRMLSKSFKTHLLLGTVQKDDFLTLASKKMLELAKKDFKENYAPAFPILKDRKEAWINYKNSKLGDGSLVLNYYANDKTINMMLDYDHKNAYKVITELAKTKENIDIIIGTQKMEVGLSIRTLDHGIITTPMNNLERLNQIVGRFERTYKQSEIDYFGHEKIEPTIDLILDNTRPCKNSEDDIRSKYGKRIINVKKKRKPLLRKKGERNAK